MPVLYKTRNSGLILQEERTRSDIEKTLPRGMPRSIEERGCLGRLYSPCLVAFKNILDQDLSEVISVSLSLPFHSL